MAVDETNSLVLTTTAERKLRVAFGGLLFAAFAVYFLYDGYVGYPARNVAVLRDMLDPRPETPPPIQTIVHPRWVKVFTPGTALADIEKHLGPAPWRRDAEHRWFGPAGCLKVEAFGDAVRTVAWVAGPHTDVYLQRWIGFALLAMAMGLGIQFVRVLMTRALLDDSGLSIRGHRHLTYDEILGLDAESFRSNGWIDLHLQHGGHKPFTLRMDAYIYDGLDELARQICIRKGWSIPPTLQTPDVSSAASSPSASSHGPSA